MPEEKAQPNRHHSRKWSCKAANSINAITGALEGFSPVLIAFTDTIICFIRWNNCNEPLTCENITMLCSGTHQKYLAFWFLDLPCCLPSLSVRGLGFTSKFKYFLQYFIEVKLKTHHQKLCGMCPFALPLFSASIAEINRTKLKNS